MFKEKLKHLKEKIKEWHNEKFGNLDRRNEQRRMRLRILISNLE